MTPAQMRQLAATRFMSASKKEWQEKAAQALLDAADQIDAVEKQEPVGRVSANGWVTLSTPLPVWSLVYAAAGAKP